MPGDFIKSETHGDTVSPFGDRKFRWPFPPTVVGFSWIVCIGVLDWLTGPEISLSAFHLPGIALAAWFSGRGQAIILCLCAATVWLLAELASEQSYSSPLIPFWNATVRLSFFLITALLTVEVSGRRKTEAALLEQDGILRSILNSMGDGVVVVGADGHIIVFNPAAESIFGSNELGNNALQWVGQIENSNTDPATHNANKPGTLRLAATGRLPEPVEMSLRAGDERNAKLLEITAPPLLGPQGQQAGVVMVITDLTARRATEKRIAEASEREQRRIGQDLHDGVCQHLVGVAFAAGSLQSRLESRNLVSEAADAGEIASLINAAISEARGLAHGLYPAGIEEGIEIALKTLASTTQERTGISCTARFEGGESQLDPVSAVHLYRIAQECITNASRHGLPKSIRILINIQSGQLSLTVTDDGKGMDASPSVGRGIGLSLMNYRSNLMGGTLAIDSKPGHGTCVTCTLPIEAILETTA